MERFVEAAYNLGYSSRQRINEISAHWWMEQRANPELVDGKQESSRSSPLGRCATVELPPAYVRLLHRRDMHSLSRNDIKLWETG
jgi:hypothetical protein